MNEVGNVIKHNPHQRKKKWVQHPNTQRIDFYIEAPLLAKHMTVETEAFIYT